MAKKYLSLEEAAGLLDMTTEQLMKVREQGEIRGFADRGSWKFREQDIDEFQRSRQADSSPDFPIMTGSSSSSVLEELDAADLFSKRNHTLWGALYALFRNEVKFGFLGPGRSARQLRNRQILLECPSSNLAS
ncbi:MAG: helix-turn-helix domain-containing protein [Planctomycetota bacterium]